MKKVLMLSLAIALLIIGGFLFQTGALVYASSRIPVTTLNEDATRIKNKYGITGRILEVTQFNKSSIALTIDGLYYIVDGKVTKYEIGKVSNKACFFRTGQYVVISPIEKKDAYGYTDYVQIRLNLSNGEIEVLTNYTKEIQKEDLNWNDEVIDYVKGANTQWFTTKSWGNVIYGLYRIDSHGTIHKDSTLFTSEKNDIKTYYKLTLDSTENLYYATVTTCDNWYTSIITRIGSDLKSNSFTIDNEVLTDYAVGPDGDMWVLTQRKTLIHMDKNGKTLMKLTCKNPKSISVASDGKVYLLEEHRISQVVGKQLVQKISLTKDYKYHTFHIINENKFSIYNENTFELHDRNTNERIVSDSFVKDTPYVVKDNLGNITILSKNNKDQDDPNTKLYRISKNGITFKDIPFNLGNIWKSVSYNNEIYIPNADNPFNFIIYRVKSNFEVEELVNIPTNQQQIFSSEVDSKGNMYFLTSQMIMVISPDGKDTAVFLPQFDNPYPVCAERLIKDKYNNIYLTYTGTHAGKPVQRLFLVNGEKNMKPVNVTLESKYANLIFLTKNQEIAMLKTDKLKTRHLYLLDKKGISKEDLSYNGRTYSTSYWLYALTKELKANDGTIFYNCNYSLIIKDQYIQPMYQSVQDHSGAIYYIDDDNLYIYDKKKPTVKAVSPESGGKKVALTENIALSISKPVLKNTNFYDIKLMANGVKIPVKCTLVENKIVIKPGVKLKAKTRYVVTVPKKAIRDVARNTLLEDYTYSFTTQ